MKISHLLSQLAVPVITGITLTVTTIIDVDQTTAASVFVDFNESSDIADFNTSRSDPVFIDPSGGIGNSGALFAPNFTDMTWGNDFFDFSFVGAEVTLSNFFLVDSNLTPLPDGINITYGFLYLVPISDGFPTIDNSLFVFVATANPAGVQPEMDMIFGGPLPRGGGGFPGFDLRFPLGTFKPGHWHELRATYQNLGNQIGFNVIVNDFGLDGIAFIETVAAINEVRPDNLGFTSDQAVYSGFRISRESPVDNFSASSNNAETIPEPSPTLSILILGAIGAGSALKRKQNK